MPAQLLYQANPPADPSLLPGYLSALKVDLPLNTLSDEELRDIKNFRRAADYIAAGMFHRRLYLLQSLMLEMRLSHDFSEE